MSGKKYPPEMLAVIKAVDNGGGQTVDISGVIDCLVAMDPKAKMYFADILNGFIVYEPEIWEQAKFDSA